MTTSKTLASLAASFWIACGACGGVRPYTGQGRELARPWEALNASCKHYDAESIICPSIAYENAMLGCVDLYESAARCRVDLTACTDRGGVDLAVASGQLLDCQAKLASPWRSPWLWGAVGLVLGVSVGVGAGLSK